MITYSFNGRLTQDAEMRTLTNGTPVLKMCVACNRPKKDPKYFYCDLYGKIADSLKPYLRKGKEVAILGTPDWNTKDGKTFETIRTLDISLLGGEVKEEPKTETPNEQAPVQYSSDEMKRQNQISAKYGEPPMYSDKEIKEAEEREFNNALKDEFGGSDCPF